MIRNTVLTRNPIFPLYDKQIYGESRIPGISNKSMKPWLVRKLIYKETAMETVMIPLRIFFQGKDDDPRLFDGKLNPILIICPLLLFLAHRRTDTQSSLEISFLSIFAICYVLYASFIVDMRIRYVAPAIPPLVVVSVFGIHNCLHWVSGIRSKTMHFICRWAIVGFVMGMLGLNVAYAGKLFHVVDPLPFIFGKTSREAYLENKLPEYPAIQYVNQIHDPDMKIMALFLGQHLYYFDKQVDFDFQAFGEMVNHSTAKNTISYQLENRGFSYCIIGMDRFAMWATKTFTKDRIKMINHWLKDDCQLLFSKNGYVVLGLRPDAYQHPDQQQGGPIQHHVQG
jgi:hypothetical protein